MKKIVSIAYEKDANYADSQYDFRPSEKYPEYPFVENISAIENKAYAMVREAIHLYGFDEENFNSDSWNPFREIIYPGNKVVIKPNLVMDYNPTGDGVECLYTQPSIVAAVIDYVCIALRGKGEIIIGDAPMQECNFQNLIKQSGYDRLIEFYKRKLLDSEITISLKDFRGYSAVVVNGVHYGQENVNAPDGIMVDLGENSEFAEYTNDDLERLRINSYNPAILKRHHNRKKHEYLINSDVLSADVIINMPKPKTHRKAGVTIALKNIVGIIVRKEYLPHHCNGDAKSGGDEYNSPSILKRIKSFIQDKINYFESLHKYPKVKILIFIRKCITTFIRLGKDQSWDGSWYGNHTISKTVADLNKILIYADKNGAMCETPQRKSIIIADMIMSGENEGPIEPTNIYAGMVCIGEDPVCFDEAVASIMGMDTEKIPTLTNARCVRSRFKLTEPTSYPVIKSNNLKWHNKTVQQLDQQSVLHFVPAVGWLSHIEKDYLQQK